MNLATFWLITCHHRTKMFRIATHKIEKHPGYHIHLERKGFSAPCLTVIFMICVLESSGVAASM